MLVQESSSTQRALLLEIAELKRQLAQDTDRKQRALYIALALAGFTIAFGTRHLDTTERHEGMVAAIALESVVKLLAFIAVGVFVTWGLFAGPGDLFAPIVLVEVGEEHVAEGAIIVRLAVDLEHRLVVDGRHGGEPCQS